MAYRIFHQQIRTDTLGCCKRKHHFFVEISEGPKISQTESRFNLDAVELKLRSITVGRDIANLLFPTKWRVIIITRH